MERLLADLDRRVARLVKRRIDEARRTYEALEGQARRRLLAAAARAGTKAPSRSRLRVMVHALQEELGQAFLLRAEDEVAAAARLHAAVIAAVERAHPRSGLGSLGEHVAETAIGGAFTEYHWNAMCAKLADDRRRAAWAARRGVVARKPLRERRALLRAAEEGVEAVRQQERAFQEEVAKARAWAAQWRQNAELARKAGSDELVAEATARAVSLDAVSTEIAGELCRYAVARARLEEQLEALRARIPATSRPS